MVHAGSAFLGMVLGRKKLSVTNLRRAGSALTGWTRSGQEEEQAERAEEVVAREKERLAALEVELQEELDELTRRHDPTALTLTTVTLKPRRADVDVRQVLLTWVANS